MTHRELMRTSYGLFGLKLNAFFCRTMKFMPSRSIIWHSKRRDVAKSYYSARQAANQPAKQTNLLCFVPLWKKNTSV